MVQQKFRREKEREGEGVCVCEVCVRERHRGVCVCARERLRSSPARLRASQRRHQRHHLMQLTYQPAKSAASGCVFPGN
jgi:hypothetical protein